KMIGRSPTDSLFLVAPLLTWAAVFAALFFPFRKICQKVGFPDHWAWFAALLLVSSGLIYLAFSTWSLFSGRAPMEAAVLLRLIAPLLFGLSFVEFFALLWVFAFVRWPARSGGMQEFRA